MSKYDFLLFKNNFKVSSYNVAYFLNKVFSEFCYSDYSVFTKRELDSIISANDYLYFVKRTEKISSNFIVNVINTLMKLVDSKKIGVTYDYYLKYLQLNINKYNIDNYDVILLDEAQDTNTVTLAIINSIKSRKVIVGDSHQQIYGFRGSFNAMNKIKEDSLRYLTHSFRFTSDIALKATKFLRMFKAEKMDIVGLKELEDIKTEAYIARTNSGLIQLIAKFKDTDFALNRSVNDIFSGPIDMLNFMSFIKTKDQSYSSYIKNKFLLEFKTLKELTDYLKETNDVELSAAFKLAMKFGGTIFELRKIAATKVSKKSRLTLTTAHSAKGLEWDKVTIIMDFRNLLELISKDSIFSIDTLHSVLSRGLDLKSIQELNLFYVAITRAKYNLNILSGNGKYIDLDFKSINESLLQFRSTELSDVSK